MSDIKTTSIGDRVPKDTAPHLSSNGGKASRRHRYQIKQQLSHKAGRQTFLAKDTQSQELVIVKLLQFDSLFKWDDLKLFEREAQTLKNLDRPETILKLTTSRFAVFLKNYLTHLRTTDTQLP